MAAEYISQCSIDYQKNLLLSLIYDEDVYSSAILNTSVAQMWQMYFGIVGVDSPAWSQSAVESNFSLDKYMDFGN